MSTPYERRYLRARQPPHRLGTPCSNWTAVFKPDGPEALLNRRTNCPPELQTRGRILDLMPADAPHRALDDRASVAPAGRRNHLGPADLLPAQDELARMVFPVDVPAHIDPAGRNRKRAILDCIGGQLVQNQREALRRLLPHHQIDSIKADTVGKRRGFGGENLTERCPAPLLLAHHGVGPTERLEPVDEHLAGVHERAISIEAVQSHRLNDGEQILNAVIELAHKQPLLLFDALTPSDVHGARSAAVVVRNALITRLVTLITRAYPEPKKGDLHLREAARLLEKDNVTRQIFGSGDDKKKLAEFEAHWIKCRGDHRLPRIKHFRDKYTAHLGEPKDVDAASYRDLFEFGTLTARAMELLALVTRVAVEPISTDPDIVSSAEAFWAAWYAG